MAKVSPPPIAHPDGEICAGVGWLLYTQRKLCGRGVQGGCVGCKRFANACGSKSRKKDAGENRKLNTTKSRTDEKRMQKQRTRVSFPINHKSWGCTFAALFLCLQKRTEKPTGRAAAKGEGFIDRRSRSRHSLRSSPRRSVVCDTSYWVLSVVFLLSHILQIVRIVFEFVLDI